MITRPSLRTLGRRSGELLKDPNCVLQSPLIFIINSIDTKCFFNCSPCVPVTFVQEVEQYITTPTTPTSIQFTFKLILRAPSPPRDVKSLIPKQTPTWGAEPGNENNAKATWLGYATIQRLGRDVTTWQ